MQRTAPWSNKKTVAHLKEGEFIEGCKKAVMEFLLPDSIQELVFHQERQSMWELYPVSITGPIPPYIKTAEDGKAANAFLERCKIAVRKLVQRMHALDPLTIDAREEEHFVRSSIYRHSKAVHRVEITAWCVIYPVYEKVLKMQGAVQFYVDEFDDGRATVLSGTTLSNKGYVQLCSVEWRKDET